MPPPAPVAQPGVAAPQLPSTGRLPPETSWLSSAPAKPWQYLQGGPSTEHYLLRAARSGRALSGLAVSSIGSCADGRPQSLHRSSAPQLDAEMASVVPEAGQRAPNTCPPCTTDPCRGELQQNWLRLRRQVPGHARGARPWLGERRAHRGTDMHRAGCKQKPGLRQRCGCGGCTCLGGGIDGDSRPLLGLFWNWKLNYGLQLYPTTSSARGTGGRSS